jgi:PBP1b-binding outer membrane lipoprotein LpoB
MKTLLSLALLALLLSSCADPNQVAISALKMKITPTFN